MRRRVERMLFQKSILLFFSLVLVFSPFSSLGEVAYADDEQVDEELAENVDDESESENSEVEESGVSEETDTDGDEESAGPDNKEATENMDESEGSQPITEDENSGESELPGETDHVTENTDDGSANTETAPEEDQSDEEIDEETPSIQSFSSGDFQTFGNVDGDYEWDENTDGTVIITGYTGSDTDLTIPGQLEGRDVTVIGRETFKNKDLTRVIIPDSVITIGNQAFRQNNLTSVKIPDSVTTIGSSAFLENKLTGVEISSSVTTIGSGAFYKNNLTGIEIPNSVTTIGGSAFYDNKLTSVEIPNSVTTIGHSAFISNNLEEVIIKNENLEFGLTIFFDNQTDSKDLTIYGHNGSTAETYANDNNHTFKVFSEGDYEWDENTDGTVTITGYRGSDTELTIPNQLDGKDVTVIGSNAFSYKNLTSVKIPDSVITIEDHAFQKNKLTSVTIPDSVITVEDHAFQYNNLTSVTIHSSSTTIESRAFDDNQTEPSDLTIYGHDPSTAKTYASANNHTFKTLTYIPDDALRKAINDELGEDESYEPTKEDLESLTELEADSKGIKNLTGLEYATNLKDLILYDNNIEDISALENLTSLKFLELGTNVISDISALSGLENLEELRLDNNNINDISALENLTSLESLYLGINVISDISALSGLENLEELRLNGNNIIEEISALSELANLEMLYIDDNDIKDIAVLKNLKELQYLDLALNKISDITALSELANLEMLYLNDNNIENIASLENLEELQYLHLDDNKISNLSPLASYFENLLVVRLNNQSIELPEIELLSTATTLKIDNPIIDYNGKVLDEIIDVEEGLYDSNDQKIKWDGFTDAESTRTFTFDDDDYGFTGEVIQPIKWVEDEKPVIHASDIFILQNETFDPLENVTATDKESGNLTDDINVTKNDVNTAVPGLYEVEYAVTDHGEQTVEKTITVTVVPKEISIPLDERTEVFPGQVGMIETTGSTITFPSDLPLGTFVTITDRGEAAIVTDAEGIERAGDVLDFEFEYPNGQSFTDSFELTMTYGNGFVTEIDIYYYNEDTQKWEAQNGTKDASNNLITINPEHFSTYGVFALTEEDSNGDDDPGAEDPNGDDDPGAEDPNGDEDPGTEDPNGDDDPSTEDPNGDDDPQEDKDDHDKTTIEDTKDDADKDKDSHELPKTATNIFNIMAIGLTLLILGSISFMFIRRRALNK